jgi:hypothetical protein
LLATFTLSNTEAIGRWMLSFGKPAELRSRIADEAEAILHASRSMASQERDATRLEQRKRSARSLKVYSSPAAHHQVVSHVGTRANCIVGSGDEYSLAEIKLIQPPAVSADPRAAIGGRPLQLLRMEPEGACPTSVVNSGLRWGVAGCCPREMTK